MGLFWQPTVTQTCQCPYQTFLGLHGRLRTSTQPSIPPFYLGSDLHHSQGSFNPSQTPSHSLSHSHKIFACLILSKHLLNNRWRTRTNTPSPVPRAKSLSLNSSVWPPMPFVIWLLLTSLFWFPLSYFVLHPHGFIHIPSMFYDLLSIGLCTRNCFFQEYFFPHHQGNPFYASVVQGSLPDSPGLN